MAFRIERGVFKFFDAANSRYQERFRFNDDGNFVELNADGTEKGRTFTTDGGTVTGAAHFTHTSNTFTGARYNLGGTTTYLIKDPSNRVEIKTPNGYLRIGPGNGSYSHFDTDRGRFYFNRQIEVAGHVSPYTSGGSNLGSTSLKWGNVYANALSIYGGGVINGNLTVGGTITAQEFHTEFVNQTVIREDGDVQIDGDLFFSGSATTTNQARAIYFSGYDKEGTTDFSDKAFIMHTTGTGGHTGSVLVISSRNDSNDGIAFDTHPSSPLKHNGHTILTSNNYTGVLDARYFTESEADGRYWRLRSISLTGSNPFDDSHTETRVTGNGNYVIGYTGASAQIINSVTGGSASVFQIGAHYNGDDYYMRTRTDSSNWRTWKKLWHNGNLTNVSQLTNDAGYISGNNVTAPFLINGAGDNSGKADFAVGVGGSSGVAISLLGTQFQVGAQDVNYDFRLDSSGADARIKSWERDIIISTDGSSSSSNVKDIRFYTKPSNGGAAERVRIDGSGYTYFHSLDLAISNANSDHGAGTYFRGSNTHFVLGLRPGNTLHFNYGNSSGTILSYGHFNHANNATLQGDVHIGNSSSAYMQFNRAGYNYIAATASNGAMVFRTGGSTNRMIIDNTGAVGIGTNNPAAKLHIDAGTVSSTSTTDVLKLQAYSGDFGATPAAIALAFKHQDSNNSTNEARIRMATVNDTDYGDNDEAASNLIFSTTNGGTESDKMIITGRGAVGIGTNNPSYKLHIAGGNNDQLLIENTTSSGTAGIFFKPNSNRNTGPFIRSNQRGGASSDSDLQLGDETGGILTLNAGRAGIGTSSPAAKLHVVGGNDVFGGWGYASLLLENSSNYPAIVFKNGNTGTIVRQDNSGKLQIGNGDTTGTFTERFTITSGGNVGIGTSAITNKLEVNGGATFNGETYVRSTSNVGIRLQNTNKGTTNTDGLRVGLNDSHAFVWQYENLPLVFATNGNQKMTILANGNVGIGTSSPSYKLHVAGDIIANNWVRVKNNDGLYFQDRGGGWHMTDSTWIRAYNAKGIRTDGQGYFGSDVQVHGDLKMAGSDSYIWTPNTTSGYTGFWDTPNSRVAMKYTNSHGGWGIMGNSESGTALKVHGSINSTGNITAPGATFNGGVTTDGQLYLAWGGTNTYSHDFILANQSWHARIRSVGGDLVMTANGNSEKLRTTTDGVRVTGQVETSTGIKGISSLYDLLIDGRATHTMTEQLAANTWTEVFQGTQVLSQGTWMVQITFNDHSQGGTGYTQMYSGTMTWNSPTSTNNTGGDAISEIALHRNGHAANAQTIYLRTREQGGSNLILEIKADRGHTAPATFNFKFVKVF